MAVSLRPVTVQSAHDAQRLGTSDLSTFKATAYVTLPLTRIAVPFRSPAPRISPSFSTRLDNSRYPSRGTWSRRLKCKNPIRGAGGRRISCPSSFGPAATMGSLTGVELVHIARETADVDRLANFYIDILGFKRAHTPDFGPFKVVWLEFSPGQQLHIVERNPESELPESPLNAGPGSRKDPSALPRGHHLSFRVADYDAAVKSLREKGFEVFEKDQQDHRIKQAFFFDPDGNGIEIGSWPK